MKPRRPARDEIDEALTDGRIECQHCETIVERPGSICRDCQSYADDCDAGMFDDPAPCDEEDF